MPGDVFLDSAYAIALASPNDDFHARAVVIAGQLKVSAARIFTTRAVILEIGNALAKQRYRRAAVALLQSFESDPSVEVAPLTEEVFRRAFALFRDRPDKEWSLTGCLSFVVMQDRQISNALTTDAHFEQAGLRAMLREPDL